MGVGISFVAFAIGAVVSLGTSWILVTRLERIGERLELSETLLGLMAALAADAPEITAAVTALAHHQRSIGVGVIVGSNIFNLAALLGLGAVVAGRIGLRRRVVVFDGAVALWVAVVCVICVVGTVSVAVGLVLVLIILVPYVIVVGVQRSVVEQLPLPSRWTKWITSAVAGEESEIGVPVAPRRGTKGDVLVAALCLVVVVGASVIMELGASALGTHYAITDIVVGAIVLAAVTSLPNAVAAVHLAHKGRGSAALSTALNSNTINVTVGLLIPATVIGLARSSSPGLLVVWWYLGITVLTLALAYVDRGLRRPSGWLIIAGYAAFVAALVAVT